MNKKKLSALLVAGTLTVGVVGGTFAWFTSQDTVTNEFSTGGTTDLDDDKDAGIDIWEKFEEPTNVVPGTTTDKLVQVKNTSNYDQFIRVKITPKWENEELNTEAGLAYIKLNFVKANIGDGQGQWLKDGDYYYYMGKVAGEKFTNTLLESVTLANDTTNEYKNEKYDVIVDADSIQADNGAYKEWKTASDSIKDELAAYETAQAIGNDTNATGTKATPTEVTP